MIRRAIFVLNQKKIKYNWIITGRLKTNKQKKKKINIFNQHYFRMKKKEKREEGKQAIINMYTRDTYDISKKH